MMKLLRPVVGLPFVGILGSLALSSALLVAACSPAATPNPGGSGGATRSGGTTGSGGTTTPSGSGGTTTAGTGGTPVTATGGTTGNSGGTTGSGGAVPPASGGSGGSGTGGTTTTDARVDTTPPDTASTGDTATPGKQFTCPAGPFANDTIGTGMAVCQGFAYRYGYNEGPTWIASQNAFFFSNFGQGNGRTGDIIKLDFATKQCEIWLRDAGCNGLAVNANGKLIGACHLTHSVTEFDLVTKAKRVIVDTYNGQNLASPNDLVAHSNGSIYFTNPTYESISANPYGTAAFWIDPAGKISLLANGGCNGIGLSPDEKTLYVVGMGVWPLDANGVPGTRGGTGPGGDGISINCAGKIFSAQTNSAFGGPDGKTLLVVQGNGARLVPMAVPGLP